MSRESSTIKPAVLVRPLRRRASLDGPALEDPPPAQVVRLLARGYYTDRWVLQQKAPRCRRARNLASCSMPRGRWAGTFVSVLSKMRMRLPFTLRRPARPSSCPSLSIVFGHSHPSAGSSRFAPPRACSRGLACTAALQPRSRQPRLAAAAPPRCPGMPTLAGHGLGVVRRVVGRPHRPGGGHQLAPRAARNRSPASARSNLLGTSMVSASAPGRGRCRCLLVHEQDADLYVAALRCARFSSKVSLMGAGLTTGSAPGCHWRHRRARKGRPCCRYRDASHQVVLSLMYTCLRE